MPYSQHLQISTHLSFFLRGARFGERFGPKGVTVVNGLSDYGQVSLIVCFYLTFKLENEEVHLLTMIFWVFVSAFRIASSLIRKKSPFGAISYYFCGISAVSTLMLIYGTGLSIDSSIGVLKAAFFLKTEPGAVI